MVSVEVQRVPSASHRRHLNSIDPPLPYHKQNVSKTLTHTIIPQHIGWNNFEREAIICYIRYIERVPCEIMNWNPLRWNPVEEYDIHVNQSRHESRRDRETTMNENRSLSFAVFYYSTHFVQEPRYSLRIKYNMKSYFHAGCMKHNHSIHIGCWTVWMSCCVKSMPASSIVYWIFSLALSLSVLYILFVLLRLPHIRTIYECKWHARIMPCYMG